MRRHIQLWLSAFSVGALLSTTAIVYAGGNDGWHGGGMANSSGAPNPGHHPPALTLADLPRDLNLSPEQRTKMEEAIKDLRAERRSLVRSWRSHRGRRGSEPGGPPWGRFGDGESPLVAFLEKASQILNPDQFTTLAKSMVERRERMRPRVQEGQDRFLAELSRRAARRLDLTDAQEEKMQASLTRAAQQMRTVWKTLGGGTATAEQARDQAHAIRTGLQAEMKSILTPGQWSRAEGVLHRRMALRLDRMGNRMEGRVDRRAAIAVRILGLSEQQAAQVRQIAEGTMTERRAVLDQVRAKALDPEDAAFKMWQISKDATQKVRALLTPEEAQKFDALLLLLPRGMRPGPGRDLGIGGPGGRPGMEHLRPNGARGGRFSQRGPRGRWGH